MEPVIETIGLTKRFGQVEAVKGVDFRISRGEVVGLLGDNGAGKSTFVSMLSGASTPSAGALVIDGVERTFSSPRAAQDLGIQTVYQDLSLALHLTPAENVYLGREIRRSGPMGRLGWIDRAQMDARTGELLRSLSVKIRSLRHACSDLSGGQRQSVAIARAFAWAQKLVILDEPTAALGVAQTQMVLGVIDRMREQRLPVILISHNMHDVFAVTTRVVVFRQGRVVLDAPTASVTRERVVAAITGATDEGEERA